MRNKDLQVLSDLLDNFKQLTEAKMAVKILTVVFL